MAFDPITSVVLGVTLLQESLHETAVGSVATIAALVAALAGMAILARTQSGTATKPLSAPATT
jgi:threonine/homoserine efflux transporter RhtA